ncbi:Hypothetical protein PSEBR_m1288 [Pseudomonas brassicacearum subsp. brassicacearum NFM421]|uniref:Uncharacterized protein n=1 Tax=Pseudomonas brassicacearum (strain NFM421) TaxID=994484 RepID=F2KKB2_PSEBN|nr:Hypothetical protein PSEBR_m1288 [Pseudomonas brassicacearum subsp. brassicacearum NFM421]
MDAGIAAAMDGPSRRPTEQCRREGTPSLGEVPSGGARAFCLLLTGPASGLLKSEPPSGRNPKQPLPQEWICTRPPVNKSKASRQAAIASKLAPTMGLW